MKVTRGKIAIALVAALIFGVSLALLHGNGADATRYGEPGQRPARLN